MSSNLIISGLPGDVTFTKLLNALRMLFKKIHISKFWIRDVCDIAGYLKQATVELTSNSDARKARTYLNNFPFKFMMMEFPLKAYIDEEAMQFVNENEFEDWGPRRKPAKQRRARPRSRSPGYRSEASKLDMEIELLRKQRQVIEEERRLLMEQKKLEMIKEYGPSASREFDKDYEPPRKRRPEPVPKGPQQRSAPLVSKAPRPKSQVGLPLFFQPCKKLIGEMRPFIENDTTPEEVEILIKLVRAAIRKDLAMALEDRDYMKHREIINLYRERHPPEEDEAFVAKILANIRASYLASETPVVKKEKVSDTDAPKETENLINDKEKGENQANVEDKGESQANVEDKGECQANEDKGESQANEDKGECQANGEKASEDTPENAENVTAAAMPDAAPETADSLETSIENITEVKPDIENDTASDTVMDEQQENELLADGEAKPADCVEEQ